MSQHPEKNQHEIIPADSKTPLSLTASENLVVIDPGPCNAKSMTALWESFDLKPDAIESISGVPLNPFNQQ